MARTVSSSAFFWEVVRRNLRSWLLGLFLGVCLLAAFIYALFIAPESALQDTESSPLQHGTGIVSVIRPGIVASRQYGGGEPAEVSIILDSAPQTHCIYTPLDNELIQVGQHVQVAYRLGKSGETYIINVKPMGK